MPNSNEFNNCEIDCLLVEKVFDQCYLKDDETRCFSIPTGYCEPCSGVDIAAVDRVECNVLSAECEVISEGEPDDESYRIITIRQDVELEIELWNDDDPDNPVFLCKFQKTINDFFTRIKLYVPEPGAQFGPGGGPFIFCEVTDYACACELLNGNEDQLAILSCTVVICKIIEVTAFVKLMVPAFGYCEPDKCEVVTNVPELDCPPDCLFPPQKPPEPEPPICDPPIARTRGFWGEALPRMIKRGEADLEQFITEVVIPIVGPGGRSQFLNTLFDPNLFVDPDIAGIYARYLEIFNNPPQPTPPPIVPQLFAVYLNIVGTEAGLLPPEELCLDENITYYKHSLVVDLQACTFEVIENVPSLIAVLVDQVDEILFACSAVLTTSQISDLNNILDDINNERNISVEAN